MQITKRNYIFGASILLCTGGLCLIFTWPVLFDCLLSLQCNPVLYYLWKNIPVDAETKFYFFNWTNPGEVHNSSIKPRFQQVGPYVFFQREAKCNIVWNDNGTVTFRQKRYWYYDEEHRNGNLQDKITSLDPALLGMSYITRTWNYYIRRGFFVGLSGTFPTIHKTHTVRELLFDGYPQPLVKMASVMPFLSHLKLPSWDRFGWMYSRNGSADFDGIFNMGTGSNSILGEVYRWNHRPNPGFFDGECGTVRGSSSQLFPRNLSRDRIDVFSSDLSRRVSFKFADEKRVNGILGHRYVAGSYMLDNGTIDPRNLCFCTGECVPSGLYNVSLTRHHAPLFASLPHFYAADPSYLNSVDGLKPEKEKHEFSITIEPTTGTVLEADAKMQANILMQPIDGVNILENVAKIYFPVIWTEQYVKIPDRETFLLKLVLALPTASISSGLIMVLISGILLLHEGINYDKSYKKSSTIQIDEKLLMLENKHALPM